MKKIESGKTNPIVKFFSGRKFRYGGFAVLLTVAFIVLVILLNVVVDAAESKWALTIDATGNAVTSFSDMTYETIASVENDVYVHLIYTENSSRSEKMDVEAIAAKFQAKNSLIHVDTIDPNTQPGVINTYKEKANVSSITEGAAIVTNADESRIKVISASDIYSKELDYYTYFTSGEENYTTVFNAESQFTNALLYVTSDSTPRVLFLAGQNEVSSSYCSTLISNLTSENYDVQTLTLGQGDITLEAGDTLVIMRPALDLTDDEYETIRNFVENSGRMLYIHDPSMDIDDTPNFKRLLDYFGFSFESGYIIEDESSTSNWINAQSYLLPNKDEDHTITADLTSSRIILPSSCASILTPDPKSGYQYTCLLTSSDKAYLKSLEAVQSGDSSNLYVKNDTDKTGTFNYAVSLLNQKDATDASQDTRIVVVGSPYLFVDTMMTSTQNIDFAGNTIDWLVNRETSSYVRSKSLLSTTLSIPDSGTALTLFIIIVVAMPLLAFAYGVYTWIKRRRL